MSDRTIGRHRAETRVKTPLTTITTGVTRALTGDLVSMSDGLGLLGRGGAAIAVTSGLVASMGLPAQANTMALESGSTSYSGAQQATLSAPAALLTGEPVEASATTDVTFEHASFKPTKVVDHRSTARASRSSTRGSLSNPTTGAKVPFGSLKGSSVLSVAARYVGVPYVYGGTTTSGFDCSGYTGYVFAALGVRLPRTAQQQMNAATIIPRSAAKPGDLVFVLSSSGHAYHVGIYAGGGRFYDAGSRGGHVSLRAIFSSSIAFGRV